MEIIIIAVVVLALAVWFLRRLSIFVERNEQRAYVMNVLHSVEVKAELDRTNGYL
ncbi:hypothetical protein SEA_A3WALLY_386 [Microbacterium phage A3Wally]|nr:hypothetical protein SEA_A3WALLY_33 [Microbacterium phage A3Wally]QWY84193.1 hypothetical protein SEA_A3WALLY_386 [Microbacterium phage A3Wally]